MGSAIAVEYEIETGLECQDTGVCWRLLCFSIIASKAFFSSASQAEFLRSLVETFLHALVNVVAI